MTDPCMQPFLKENKQGLGENRRFDKTLFIPQFHSENIQFGFHKNHFILEVSAEEHAIQPFGLVGKLKKKKKAQINKKKKQFEFTQVEKKTGKGKKAD